MPEIFKSDTLASVSEKTAVSGETKKQAQSPTEVVTEVLRRVGEKKHSEVIGSYMVYPGKAFIGMQNDEAVALLLRAHPITNVKWILLALLMLVIPGLLMLLGMFDEIPTRLVFLGRLTWYLVILGFSFEKFLHWYYSIVIVTNERVVDIDFVNLLHRHISYAVLNHIEEPSVRSGGILRSLFHYGDLFIATAAEESGIEATDIPFPDRAVRIISELQEELEKRRERGE